MSLTATQIQDIVITERISSILSLVGTAFVIGTFLLNNKFRKPINRLVFYATFGNILTNVATLVSTDGIEAGQSSSLCQFQAFLIQWYCFSNFSLNRRTDNRIGSCLPMHYGRSQWAAMCGSPSSDHTTPPC